MTPFDDGVFYLYTSEVKRMSNTVTATYSNTKVSVTRALHQYDYGQKLVLDGFDMEDGFEAHFANSEEETAIVKTGRNNEVLIPNQVLKSGQDIICWIYGHSFLWDGETVYTVHIPVIKRSEAPGCHPEEPTEWIFDGLDAEYD